MNAIITFQGFTEGDDYRTGTEDLYFSIIRKFAGENVTTYHPEPWTADVKTIALQLARQHIRNVAMISYSHGQASACDFAKACYALGITVDLWLACDPVYRPAWLPRFNFLQPLAFRALSKSPKIKVPQNVRRVAGVRQKFNWPSGHDLIATGDTHIEVFPFVPMAHTEIDASREWYDLVRYELSIWASPPKAIPVPLEDL